ncbi:hypothetical protein HMPREF1253_1792 [Peptoniphilus sp. BV3C26]|nr:hypothetical protein HMPREF1253_1792 [Peptoniphilus sp. BV3C26]
MKPLRIKLPHMTCGLLWGLGTGLPVRVYNVGEKNLTFFIKSFY